MVVWKEAFEKINIELDLTKKKKQALDDLLNVGRISQLTYESLSKNLNEDINQIELRRKALAEKIASKLSELEEQLQTLEFFLANSEMAYAAGEMDPELYAKESSALNLGMEATKQELNWIKEVIIQLVPQETSAMTSAPPSTVESVEATPTETAVENAPQVAASTPSAPIETPTEVTPPAEETTIKQPDQVAVQTAPETPTETTPTTEPSSPSSEGGGQEPFRDPGDSPPPQDEKKEG